ncbi:MAG: tRNA (adenosine(37)-N6)-threonylcarbamoyltransferase complex transferase subunit TsaD [Deltaproteobacteria bacterium]|jgi:N6-L-threonylcarbamoyladenine synthase|nr:tRNA (adenosine(37)-N6)-threonylcarbamoyltransferase complex transferase subunit TsaD [Deltaproteobacteria bacterium]
MLILGIESSCDETAAAVMRDDQQLLANVVDSQIAIHAEYGGVVPEIASRKHLENIYPVVTKALADAQIGLDDIDLLAVTAGPGLIGSLLVGLNFVKALALIKKIPFVGVDHMAGHLLSVYLGEAPPEFPFVALIASGGHSSLFHVRDFHDLTLLGRTRDDAAGEAFDKVAKLLDLPYPGGPEIGRIAKKGNPQAITFPRSWLEPGSYDFSFSGLKTSVANQVNKMKKGTQPLPVADISASFQEAVVDVLTQKSIRAAQEMGCKTVVVAGGVAANSRLREMMTLECHKAGLELAMPPVSFCTDNAAMICLAGFHQYQRTAGSPLDLDVYSRSPHLMQG